MGQEGEEEEKEKRKDESEDPCKRRAVGGRGGGWRGGKWSGYELEGFHEAVTSGVQQGESQHTPG